MQYALFNRTQTQHAQHPIWQSSLQGPCNTVSCSNSSRSAGAAGHHPDDPYIPHATHRQRKVVKNFCAVPPHVGVAVFALTLIIESIDLQEEPSSMSAGVPPWQGTSQGAIGHPWQCWFRTVQAHPALPSPSSDSRQCMICTAACTCAFFTCKMTALVNIVKAPKAPHVVHHSDSVSSSHL